MATFNKTVVLCAVALLMLSRGSLLVKAQQSLANGGDAEMQSNHAVEPLSKGECAEGLNACNKGASDHSQVYCCATACLDGHGKPYCLGDTEPGYNSFATPAPAPPTASASPTVQPLEAAGTVASPEALTATSNLASGSFATINKCVGFSAQHGTPVPFTTKCIMFDRNDVGPSQLYLSDGKTYAYAGEYDWSTNTIRGVSVPSNTWCGAGAYKSDGTVLETGGGDYTSNNAAIRSFNTGGDIQFVTNMSVPRWYPSTQILPDGRMMVVGGQDLNGPNQASYEFYPPDGQGPHPLQILIDEQGVQLYPFCHLLPDGRMFLFAGVKCIIFDYKQNTVTNLPSLNGNARQYPQSGSSAMLPLHASDGFKVKIMVCGGGNGGNRTTPASNTGGIINLSASNPSWTYFTTPTRRVMGYLVYLLDGTLLYICGGLDGYAGYGSSNNPNYTPDFYNPATNTWGTVSASTNIARLYHSCAYLLTDGRVFIHGSNPRGDYYFNQQVAGVDVTQCAVEAFSPWYMNNPNRPSITISKTSVKIGQTFTVNITVPGVNLPLKVSSVRCGIIQPGFTTHAVSMNQRYIYPAISPIGNTTYTNSYTVKVPNNVAVCPPNPYYVTCMYAGVPSPAQWISITL